MAPVPLAAAPPRNGPVHNPRATLVAQLLAVRFDQPAYRTRRREAPGTASEAYRRAAALGRESPTPDTVATA